jgi:hypothetical protein
MTAHLNDEELAHWVLGDRDADAEHHLAHCGACRETVEHVNTYIGNHRDAVLSASERPQIFWAKQTRAIDERLCECRPMPLLRWAYAVTMILVLCATFLVTRIPHPQQRGVTSDSADEVLLLQVENDVAREYPIALAPAALIADERDGVLSTSDETSFNHAIHKEQDR